MSEFVLTKSVKIRTEMFRKNDFNVSVEKL